MTERTSDGELVIDLNNEEGKMVEVEELPTSATSATSGGTDPLSVLKENRLAQKERMLHSQRKQRHHPRR